MMGQAGVTGSRGGAAERAGKSLRARLRISVLLFAVVLASGCATVRFGYDHAEGMILFWADRYLDFDREQEQFARMAFASWLQWHRLSEVPAYRVLLLEAQAMLAQPVDAEQLLALEERIRARLLGEIERALPELARLGLMLNSAQIDRLEAKLAEGTRKAERERRDDERTVETRLERYRGRFEHWIGDLEPSQEQTLRTLLREHPSHWQDGFAARRRWQAALVALLREWQKARPADAIATEHLGTWLKQAADPLVGQDPQRAAVARLDVAHIVTAMINSATPAQKAKVRARLADYAEDFRSLTASGRGP